MAVFFSTIARALSSSAEADSVAGGSIVNELRKARDKKWLTGTWYMEPHCSSKSPAG